MAKANKLELKRKIQTQNIIIIALAIAIKASTLIIFLNVSTHVVNITAKLNIVFTLNKFAKFFINNIPASFILFISFHIFFPAIMYVSV